MIKNVDPSEKVTKKSKKRINASTKVLLTILQKVFF